ncbi:DyP-type peroxidase [Pleurotus ostreatus PC15]|uniref:DyP-type peroxidase n=1 Tax=Pleurotus ostreatus (strain PC15) TaxID=1137138 RepID=A0A067N4E7_PLEO1|nr:dye-decolorizing peroxidase 4 [synthetic construct]KDQ22873.1 DyP-type peroxidase [Pleurotus ostreatus PC15]
MTTPAPPLDLNNIQGDILGGLPKRTETYFFFDVTNVDQFKANMAHFIPHIKTSAGIIKDREAIKEHKRQKKPGLVPMAAVNVSFSHLGLQKLGITDDLSDNAFTTGQRKDAEILGDPGSKNGDAFTPAWEAPFLKDIHGVIFVAGDCHGSVNKKLDEIKHIFGVGTSHASISEVTHVRGDVRPGDVHAHEHFGFLDGISNPAVEQFDQNPLPGQDPIRPGFILAKENGDSRAAARPDWAKDGSFLTFRYLFQMVPEFDDFLESNPIVLPGLSRKEGSELLGARIVGRWKSGAPIEITPLKDDPKLAADAQRNNKFDFGDSLVRGDQTKCPFAAHIRKTYPRNDLEGPPLKADIDNRRIIRRGIQFGPEVTSQEHHDKKTHHGRGLLFVCYSSSIDDGFHFIQESWANAPNFPVNAVTSAGPIPPLDGVVPGFDAIIGQKVGGGIRQISGTNPNDPTTNITLPDQDFVVPRGGEYFFSPSITALKTKFAIGVASPAPHSQAPISA